MLNNSIYNKIVNNNNTTETNIISNNLSSTTTTTSISSLNNILDKNNQDEEEEDKLIAHKLAHALRDQDTDKFINIYDKIPLHINHNRVSQKNIFR